MWNNFRWCFFQLNFSQTFKDPVSVQPGPPLQHHLRFGLLQEEGRHSMGGVPSKPGDPSRPLEVIGAGFSKTGTLSMQLALQELLQGPVIHGGTQSVFPGDGSSLPSRFGMT